MTRKDYILIAEALKSTADSMDSKVAKSVVRFAAINTADALATDNPRFDKQRFLKACGF